MVTVVKKVTVVGVTEGTSNVKCRYVKQKLFRLKQLLLF
ncbi:hypothetical protein HNQ91_001495 [Filimonas zeae]|nr:hypothetical protein [Filimonas zeae]